MKINLNKEEKLELLRASSMGVLNTNKIPRITKEIKGVNEFLELMMEVEDEN